MQAIHESQDVLEFTNTQVLWQVKIKSAQSQHTWFEKTKNKQKLLNYFWKKKDSETFNLETLKDSVLKLTQGTVRFSSDSHVPRWRCLDLGQFQIPFTSVGELLTVSMFQSTVLDILGVCLLHILYAPFFSTRQ